MAFGDRHLAIRWAQGGGAASVEGGEYAVLTSLDGPRDVGSEFEIMVQVVDGAERARLDAWFKQTEATGSYPGMSLPPFVAGCGAPPRVTVIKTRREALIVSNSGKFLT